MKCENLQFSLSVYADNCLSEDERAVVDRHLGTCPLCRQKLADFQALRNNLRGLTRPAMPENLLNSVRSAVAAELQPVESATPYFQTESFRRWLEFRLMPYTVGVVTSLVLGFTLLWTLLSGLRIPPSAEIAGIQPSSNRAIMLETNSNTSRVARSDEFELSPSDYAALRFSVSSESPSVNPTGALIALTKSFVSGKMKDDEMTVVADVFGDGLAEITEIVEAPDDTQTIYELEKALETDSGYAPFVPARLDNRSDMVRVVLKIQRVDVVDSKPKSRKRKL